MARKNGPWAIALLALVLAISGSAAAAKYVITSTKQIKPSVRKALEKPGPAGKDGTNGSVGPAGSAGKDGTNGTNGKDGTNGVSVTSSAASKGECPYGGTKFEAVNGLGKACNGSPWTVDGVLPTGATETGPWSMIMQEGEQPSLLLAFTIPLADPLPASQVHYVTTPTAVCPGSAAQPEAEEGHLCVYQEAAAAIIGTFDPEIKNPASKVELGPGVFLPADGAATAGALLQDGGSDFFGFAFGTWAVTGK
jgi:hypothetical protein